MEKIVAGLTTEILTCFGATSLWGITVRMACAVTPTSSRTTVRQHDMFIWPHSFAIFTQQSASACVSGWSGMKHAICGASPQTTTIARANARNDQDMDEVYTGIELLDAYSCALTGTETDRPGFPAQ